MRLGHRTMGVGLEVDWRWADVEAMRTPCEPGVRSTVEPSEQFNGLCIRHTTADQGSGQEMAAGDYYCLHQSQDEVSIVVEDG